MTYRAERFYWDGESCTYKPSGEEVTINLDFVASVSVSYRKEAHHANDPLKGFPGYENVNFAAVVHMADGDKIHVRVEPGREIARLLAEKDRPEQGSKTRVYSL